MRALVVVLILALVLSGCSILFVEGPHVIDAKVVCTDEFTMPLVDAAVAVAGVATPFILEANRDRRTENPNYVLEFGALGIAVGAAISSVIGITKVKRCRRTSHVAAV